MIILHLNPDPETREKLRVTHITRVGTDLYSIHPYDGPIRSARLPAYKVSQPTDFVALIAAIDAAQTPTPTT
jgi:hypothetical protein